MNFLTDSLNDYVEQHTETEPSLLTALNRQTHLKVLQPRMLSGHFQGRLLSMLAHLVQPKRILEIGTYTGYSALCLSEGLSSEGKLITIDCNYELEDFARSYFEKAGKQHQIELRIGDAMEIVPTLQETFDLVFIDADKSNYLNYYHMVLPMVSPGGLIIADNVLWSGKVLDPENNTDADTEALLAFNAFVHNDVRVQEVLLPVRDGLMLIRKKD